MAAFPVEIATSFDGLRMSGGVGVLRICHCDPVLDTGAAIPAP